MNDKEKLKKTAHVFSTIVYVLTIVSMVGFILAFVSAFLLFLFTGLGIVNKIYEALPLFLKDMKYSFDYDYFFSITQSGTLDEAYNALALNKVALGYGFDMIFTGAEGVFLFVVLRYIRRIFIHLEECDTPFTKGTLRLIKRVFILVTVMISIKNLLYGFIIGSILACMYVIMECGIRLQESEDRTL